MTDFLERLSRRLERKQAEEPAVAPAKEARVDTGVFDKLKEDHLAEL